MTKAAGNIDPAEAKRAIFEYCKKRGALAVGVADLAALEKIASTDEATRQEVESLKRERDELARDRDEMLRLPKIRPISMPPPHLSRENP